MGSNAFHNIIKVKLQYIKRNNLNEKNKKVEEDYPLTLLTKADNL